MKESTIWLEVNVNIGSRSLRINIRKGQSIELVVKEFIREHSLSEQYMPIIISMIKQQVQLKVSQENQAGMHAYTEGNVA
jgi:HKD family nuclease